MADDLMSEEDGKGTRKRSNRTLAAREYDRERYRRLKEERANDPAKMEEHRKKRREAQRRYKLKHPETVREQRARDWVSLIARRGDEVRSYKRIQSKLRRERMTPEQREAERLRSFRRSQSKRSLRGIHHQPALGQVLRTALCQNELYRVANAATPCSLPTDIRDDVVSEMILAVLEGRLGQHQIIHAAPRFVSQHFRAREWAQTLSLDAIVPGTDHLRLIDTIAAE